VRPGVIARPPDPNDNIVDGIESPDPLEDPSAVIQGRDPRVVQPPFVMRPPIQQTDTDADQDADAQKDDEAPPAGVAPTPANPFGVPFGSSATPGVISPAPKPETQQQQQRGPTRVPTNRVQ
jgi:hypothetical protein